MGNVTEYSAIVIDRPLQSLFPGGGAQIFGPSARGHFYGPVPSDGGGGGLRRALS